MKQTLAQVQHHLFIVGAELAALTSKKASVQTPKITTEHTEFLEKTLFPLEKELPTQKGFILPNGTEAAAHLHLARTICRRAERKVVGCGEQYNVNPEISKYLNRLGDLLFLFARLENAGKVEEERVEY